MDFLQKVFSMRRRTKRIVSIIFDSLFICTALFLSFVISFDAITPIETLHFIYIILLLVPLSIWGFVLLGLYRAILRYMSLQALWAIICSTLFSTFLLLVLINTLHIKVSLACVVLYGCFNFILIGGSRALIRAYVRTGFKKHGEPVIIYGAGASGRQLVTALVNGREYNPVAFIDDDNTLHGASIQGVFVHSPSVIKKLIPQKSVTKILLAMPSASRNRRKEILHYLEEFAVKVMTIPGMADLVDGHLHYSDVKEVDIEDLLGRDAIEPRHELMSADLKDKVVMVTGAGGSIGSELCRQIIRQEPKKLVLFELSEFALYAIERELIQLNPQIKSECDIIPILGSVQNKKRLLGVMKAFGVQTIYHAAAYKHVPMVALNPIEGIRNNIFGTMRTALAAIEAKVETFVLISTDKAVRPTNTMGTTKRMAELILQALADNQSGTRFCMVRFGNVLGSSGSVIPLFRKQIAAGGPVTVTHKDITRFFMTIPEASQLVIQAGAMGKGGDVFVLDMGKSIKINSLAKKMIRLSGYEVKDELNPFGDIEIIYNGLRPGEKLYEELLIGENVSGTDHERIMTANEDFIPWEQLQIILDNLKMACNNYDHQAIRTMLMDAPTGFKPNDGICDLIWLEKLKQENAANNAIINDITIESRFDSKAVSL